MELKADWQPYLRQLRTQEIELIFGHCAPGAFARGLELGAGDGFQSRLLARYVRRLVATDFRPQITASKNRTPEIEFMTCDAERVDEAFPSGQFDLIFSSNMMEHLPDPTRALRGMRTVLADDGLAIHVIPSPFWKVCHVAGFYPNAVLDRLDRRLNGCRNQVSEAAPDGAAWDNNPKVTGPKRSYLARLLWPAAHGASGSNLQEFRLFSRNYWKAEFESAGFRVAAMHRGPASSGYGFGWDGLRSLCQRVGLSSETVYVTVKAGGSQPDRLRYFV